MFKNVLISKKYSRSIVYHFPLQIPTLKNNSDVKIINHHSGSQQ